MTSWHNTPEGILEMHLMTQATTSAFWLNFAIGAGLSDDPEADAEKADRIRREAHRRVREKHRAYYLAAIEARKEKP